MYQSTTQIRVRYAETDQMSVVYYGNYAQYFEVGRVEAIRQLGYSYKAMEEEGIILPVVEMHAKYLRSASYDELLTIITTIKEMPTKHEIVFDSEIYNDRKKLLTKATVHLYFVDKNNWKKTHMPKKLEEQLKKFF
ncbi:acyl-CoA thioesterase [Arachidicoccus sp.]|uniref:acyl-CoA thioesterase n=1 Tax=Arachidicoccus sp. TaxID=1872624 RepID=UPI003D23FE5D